MAKANLISVSTIRMSANPTALAIVGGILLAITFIVAFGVPWVRDMAVLP